jgi:hypothetical protein
MSHQWTIGQRVRFVGFPIESLGTVVDVAERYFLVLWDGERRPTSYRLSQCQHDKWGNNLGLVVPEK